jgi:hypothetical protein
MDKAVDIEIADLPALPVAGKTPKNWRQSWKAPLATGNVILRILSTDEMAFLFDTDAI